MKRFVLLILIVFYSSQVLAQDMKAFKQYMNEGKEYFDQGRLNKSLTAYKNAYKIQPKDEGVNYSIALCYHFSYLYKQSLTYLLAAPSMRSLDPMYSYYLAHALHSNYEFEKAIQEAQAFVSLKNKDLKPEQEKLQLLIKQCHKGITLVKSPVEVKISNLGANINSSYPDYNPAINADETSILFTSRRSNSTGGEIFPMDDFYFEDIYYSNKSTSWNPANNIGTKINTNGHDACVGLSADGQTMLIYKDDNGGDLYYSQLVGKDWQSPISFGNIINSNYYEPCAALSSDNKILFFVSDRPGGFGGRDIYYSILSESGVWSKPTNMGPHINTIHDEFSPYLHADGKTFYFSSNGEHSMGGYDIFSIELFKQEQVFTTAHAPLNLGHPINTPDDEIYFVWSADNKRAYFSSVREGGFGDKDLYLLERPQAKAELAILKGTVIDCESKLPVKGKILVYDNETGKSLGEYHSNESTGKYLLVLPSGKNYGIEVTSDTYLFYSKNIDIPNLKEYKEIEDLICLNRAKVGTKIILHNVFFDIDRSTLRTDSEVELLKLYEVLANNPLLKIEISGHTDSDGDELHNLKLSDDRAKAVKDYLVKKGISESRLVYKGYGESQPMAENNTPENKQLNRRTEIKIIGN
jgi:outer membrane protein OmpA-like peptidoglycan-associated protein